MSRLLFILRVVLIRIIKRGVYLPLSSVIENGVEFNCKIGGRGKITAGGHLYIARGAMLYSYGGQIVIGSNVYIGHSTILYGHGGLVIGNDVLIGPNVVVIPSSHQFGLKNLPIRLQGERRLGIEIADDTWIGANVVIQDGCKIGKGSIVGSSSVLRSDVPPYEIWAGVPAKKVGER
jgi:acetyltransferase-like isoleucine patch superfamily enzyme